MFVDPDSNSALSEIGVRLLVLPLTGLAHPLCVNVTETPTTQ